jgi:hypothetical protein
LEICQYHHNSQGGKGNISRLRLRSNSFHIFRIILNVAFYIGLSPIKILSNESDSVRISKLTKRRKVTFIIVDMQAKTTLLSLSTFSDFLWTHVLPHTIQNVRRNCNRIKKLELIRLKRIITKTFANFAAICRHSLVLHFAKNVWLQSRQAYENVPNCAKTCTFFAFPLKTKATVHIGKKKLLFKLKLKLNIHSSLTTLYYF